MVVDFEVTISYDMESDSSEAGDFLWIICDCVTRYTDRMSVLVV